MMEKTDPIAFIEELAANAWPPQKVQIVGGWRLRASEGVTRRANSVYPNDHNGNTTLTQKLAIAETFYRRLELPTTYQISPACKPANLPDILYEQGYQMSANTAVQTACTKTVIEKIQPRLPANLKFVTSSEPTSLWCKALARIENLEEHSAKVRIDIMKHIAPRAVYLAAKKAGTPIAVGRGVLERGWLGVFSMATHPHHRRQGYALAILGQLAQYARMNDIENMYLQVMDENTAANALYSAVGFQTLYHYYYLQRK